MSDFGFEVSASFEELFPPPKNAVVRGASGVLLACELPYLPSQYPGRPPVIKQKYLMTRRTLLAHGDLLRFSDYPYDNENHPVMEAPKETPAFRFASRFRLWASEAGGAGARGLELGVMLGANQPERGVQDHPDYAELRCTVAVACAQAVLEHLGDGQPYPIDLIITRNFERPLFDGKEAVGVENLADFYEQLTVR